MHFKVRMFSASKAFESDDFFLDFIQSLGTLGHVGLEFALQFFKSCVLKLVTSFVYILCVSLGLLDLALQVMMWTYMMLFQAVLFLIYFGLTIFCRLNEMTHKLEKLPKELELFPEETVNVSFSRNLRKTRRGHKIRRNSAKSIGDKVNKVSRNTRT